MFAIPKATALRLDRRKFLTISGGLVAAGVLPRSAQAFAGPVRAQQGAFELIVVSDGTIALPWAIVNPNADPKDLKRLRGAAATADSHMAQMNAVVARAGDEVFLFDTGAGDNPASWPDGDLLASLAAVNLTPGDITKVIYTHLHPDHLFGTFSAKGEVLFSKASFHISENEYNFWANPGLAAVVPAEMKRVVTMSQQMLTGLGDKIQTFKTETEVVPGINAMSTPGHVSFEVAGGDDLIIVGDVVALPEIFFAQPDAAFGYDADVPMAAKSRRSLLSYAASGHKKMLGCHWAYPGFGLAEAKDGAFTYIAAE